jgi:hypothetical protein
MPSKRDIISKIAERAREDPQFFHKLVSNPEAALADVEGLDAETRAALMAAARPGFLSSFLATAVRLPPCVPTCDASCSYTCSSFSCDFTCGGDSCGTTCQESCGHTVGVIRQSIAARR